MHVGHVEIVALIAPAFVEDLFELLFRFKIHAQRNVQTTRTGLRRIAISINEEQLRRGRLTEATAWTTTLTTATTRGAINQPAFVGADLVSRDVADKRRRTAIA